MVSVDGLYKTGSAHGPQMTEAKMGRLNAGSQPEDVLLWCIEHDARIDQMWRQQHDWNERREVFEVNVKAAIDDLKEQIGKLQIRVAVMSGIAALVGASITPIITTLLGKP